MLSLKESAKERKFDCVLDVHFLPASARNEPKKRRLRARGASKFGKKDRDPKFNNYAEFFAIPYPLRIPLPLRSCGARSVRRVLSRLLLKQLISIQMRAHGMRTKRLRVCREIYLSTVRFVQWLELLIARGYLLFWKGNR